MTLRDSLPFMAIMAVIGVLASAYAVAAFYEGRFVVTAMFAGLSVVPFTLAVHMWNESDR